jgi:hypothetical protein
MLPKRHRAAFDGFCDAAYDDEILGTKTVIMLQLATAMAVGCYP